MLERLELVRLKPRYVLDAGAGAGEGASLLMKRYPGSSAVVLDGACEALKAGVGGQGMLSRIRRLFGMPAAEFICADFSALPLAGESCQLVWSNLALAWAARPDVVFDEFRRVLAVGGLLMFSSFGPDTLRELRDAFSGVDDYPHTLHFPDMHDLGDMLVGAGFADPVMDMESFTLTYQDMGALARDLRMSGQSNSAQGRRRTLMGKGPWKSACQRYEMLRRDGRLPATFEIVYGHAWKVPSRRKQEGPAIVNTDLLKIPRPRSGQA